MTVARWRCSLDGWDITDYVDPSGGYSVAAPAEEIVFKDDATERTILYHHVRSHPAESRYIVVAGYRRTGSEPYEDEGSRKVEDIEAIPEEDRPVIRSMFADIAHGRDVYFYGDE